MDVEKLFEDCNNKLFQHVQEFVSVYDNCLKRIESFKKQLEEHKQNGVIDFKGNSENLTKRKESKTSKGNKNSLLEKLDKKHSQRKALREANSNVNLINPEARNNLNVFIKVERLSSDVLEAIQKNTALYQQGEQKVLIKQEKKSVDSMPPPTNFPKRTRTRKEKEPSNVFDNYLNVKVQQEQVADIKPNMNIIRDLSDNNKRESDVILKNSISVIEVLDTDEEKEAEDEETSTKPVKSSKKKINKKNTIENGDISDSESVRATRTKTRAKIKKERETENEKTEELTQSSDNENGRSTRTKTKTRIKNDVIEQSDSEDKNKKTDTEERSDTDSVRLTRTKTRARNEKQSEKHTTRTQTKTTDNKEKSEESAKRLRSSSRETDKENNVMQKSKSKANKKIKPSDEGMDNSKQSVYEDALPLDVQETPEENKNTNKQPETIQANVRPLNETYQVLNKVNETFAIDKANETVTVQKPVVCRPEDLITDDESIVEDTPPKQKKPKEKKLQKTAKQIFSPFDNSPVKKRVELYEKLVASSENNGAEMPVRMTRTKKKALAKEKENEEIEKDNAKSEIKFPKEKAKANVLTPLSNNRPLPKTFNSASKIQNNSLHKNAFNESLISTKSASALKISQNEFKERELKRREKEAEALRKREALLQAQIEEKRRRREEKQMKAQQQREALEKDKQKLLEEAEKMKEEKAKQLLAEKEEKQQKMREEAHKRRLLVQKRAEEKRKEEELRRKMEEEEQMRKLEEERKKMEWRPINSSKVIGMDGMEQAPIYLVKEAPLLPTDDCYDSDDPQASSQLKIPGWATKTELYTMCRCMYFAGDKIKNTFFRCNPQSPDLRKIFYRIDSRKLKRTSSAEWHVRPRYTILSDLTGES